MKILPISQFHINKLNKPLGAGFARNISFTSHDDCYFDVFEKQGTEDATVKSLGADGKQILDINNCFAKMKYCSKDMVWAKKMNDEIRLLSSMMDNGASFEEVLEQAEKDVAKIQDNEDWGKKCTRGGCEYIMNEKVRGHKEYFDTYNDLINSSPDKYYHPETNSWYRHANTVTMHKDPDYDDVIIIDYGFNPESAINNMNMAAYEYDELMELTPPFALDEILKSVATIRWLIAQETPYERGSNSIGGLITRALLYHFNIYQSPKKDGIGMDFEAFYRDLDDYIEAYPTFFEQRPYFMKN